MNHVPRSSACYAHIKDALLEGRYRPGDRIVVTDVAAELGMSRHPVMEALKQLAMEHFVEIVPQVGCRVIRPDLQNIQDHFRFMARVEGLTAELAAERSAGQDLTTLSLVSTRIGRLLTGDFSKTQQMHDYRRLNRQFHSMIHDLAAAPLLTSTIAGFFDRNDFFISMIGGSLFLAERLDSAHQEHEAILDAIRAGDPARARAAAENHLAQIGEGVLGHAQEDVP